MKPTINLGRWFGVPIGLHYSWFVIASLIALSLTRQFAALNPSWSLGVVWALALITAILFFVSIVLHEIAHATVARLGGLPVRGITLFALGGIAQIEKDAASPGREFWMAVAGPAASVGIGFVCRAIAGATRAQAASAVFAWLGYINLALAVFNLIPGFPLDGGRVLRSIIWAITDNADRATRAAARVGQVVAFIFIAGGLFSMLTRGTFGGLWIAFIGWFLLEAAQAYYQQTELSSMLRGVRVADVMMHHCATVAADTTVRQFVNEYLLYHAGRCYVVSRNHQVVGLIAADDIKRVARNKWEHTTVADAVRPLHSVHAVAPEMGAGEALSIMAREHLTQMPVVTNGHLEGVVTMSYLVRQIRLRQELHT